MIAAPLTTIEFFRSHYCRDRPLAPGTQYQYLRSLRLLDEWYGEPLKLPHLAESLVSEWIVWLEGRGLAPVTVADHRRNVLIVWRQAARDGHCQRPEEVRRVRVPQPVPVAWTLEEVRRLIGAAERMPGYLGNGLPSSRYLVCLLRTAYESGLRRGDLFRLSVTDVAPDGSVRTLQGKTRLGHVARLQPPTVRLLGWLAGRLKGDGDPHWQTPLRWPHATRWLYTLLERVRTRACVSDGALQQIRRTGATQIEKCHPGAAMRYLGHLTPGLAYRHYVDRQQLGVAIQPPQL